jgi:4-hydroxy-2-oxoheptanedioate aldolase
VQIETIQAVQNAEEILSVPGVDGCWVGPADLGLSMGVDLNTDAGREAHEQAIDRALAACRKMGKIPGIAARPNNAQHYIDKGFQFITVGSELLMMTNGANDVLGALRR